MNKIILIIIFIIVILLGCSCSCKNVKKKENFSIYDLYEYSSNTNQRRMSNLKSMNTKCNGMKYNNNLDEEEKDEKKENIHKHLCISKYLINTIKEKKDEIKKLDYIYHNDVLKCLDNPDDYEKPKNSEESVSEEATDDKLIKYNNETNILDKIQEINIFLNDNLIDLENKISDNEADFDYNIWKCKNQETPAKNCITDGKKK